MVAHCIAFLVRLLIAAGICAALPYSFIKWGDNPDRVGVEGPTVLAILMGMCLWSLIAASVYLLVGSVCQYLLRRHLRYAIALDSVLGIGLITLSIHAGVMAKYSVQTTQVQSAIAPSPKPAAK